MMDEIRSEIERHKDNAAYRDLGYKPVFMASPTAKIVIIGQAPGRKAQESGVVWNDASGDRLIDWLGISAEMFRNQTIISHLPMDFYYPGRGVSGDLPPRQGFAQLWHGRILQRMPSVELKILVGQYAQKYYMANNKRYNLTETVRNFREYLPGYFPLVHPSPLNFRWMNKNVWFESEVIPALQSRIKQILLG